MLKAIYDAIPTNKYTGYAFKLDYMPDAPYKCISLILDNSNSSKPISYFGQPQVINNPVVLLTVRDPDYLTGYNECESLRAYLNQLSVTGLLGIYSIGSVRGLGEDSHGNRKFEVQFKIMIKE